MQDTWSDNRFSWMALHLTPGLGNVALKNLIIEFGTPENILQAGLSDLKKVGGVRPEIAQRIKQRTYEKDPDRVIKNLEKAGIRFLTYSDPEYPPFLKEIYGSPMILYIRGKDIPLNQTLVAVVGSRNATPYGLKAAENIANGLSKRGIGVVSGMARGIDAAAHRGCLADGGFTLAVLGTGIDVIYPPSNIRLFELITRKGTVISEFPPGTPPEPKHFPIRNRIISGLCKAVVVAEATRHSGSLITASLALEQGREVFAVPGSIGSFKSTGCHFLIKHGAGLIENADDILEGLGLNFNHVPKTGPLKEKDLPPMDDLEKAVYETLGDYPVHIDQISRASKLDHPQVAGILVRMELKGMVRQFPGKMYAR